MAPNVITRRRWLLGCAGSALAWRAAPARADSAATRVFDADSFARIRAAHGGHPLVVHLWGLTCGPCLDELPRWGALLRQRPGTALVLIQADATPPGAADVLLRRAGLARAERWAVAEEMDEFMRAGIDPSWSGELPRTLLFGAQGAPSVAIRGVADLREVRRWLDDAARSR